MQPDQKGNQCYTYPNANPLKDNSQFLSWELYFWNSLPLAIREKSTRSTFRRYLANHLLKFEVN